MRNIKIELYPEARATLFVLFITDFDQMLSELHFFGKEHLLFLTKNGLIDSTMEVVTKIGLDYVVEIKKELSLLNIERSNPEITKFSQYFGTHLMAALVTLYLLNAKKIHGAPNVISTESYNNIFITHGLIEQNEYTITNNGLQMLYHIGEQIEITTEKIELQNSVNSLSNQEASILFAISLSLVNTDKTSSTHQRLCDKGLIESNYESITQAGLNVLLRYEELHQRKLSEMLNDL